MIHGHRIDIDHGAGMTINPSSFCQTNITICPGEISAIFGSNFEMPVVYYRQLISVAYGCSAEESALDGQLIKAKELEEIAAK